MEKRGIVASLFEILYALIGKISPRNTKSQLRIFRAKGQNSLPKDYLKYFKINNMARATTKKDLLQDSSTNFEKLFALIDSMTEEQQEKAFSFEDRDKNIRDVLVHLWEWHQLLIKWIRSNMSGEKRNFLPDPYNWKTYPQMNIEFWNKHQKKPYSEAITLLTKSHNEVMELIETFSNEQLFEKKVFSWTGTTSLGSYCVSATTSHYEWAMKKIKTHKKSL